MNIFPLFLVNCNVILCKKFKILSMNNLYCFKKVIVLVLMTLTFHINKIFSNNCRIKKNNIGSRKFHKPVY